MAAASSRREALCRASGELRHEPPFLLVRQAGKLEAHRLGEALKALLELLGEGPVPLQVEDGHHLPRSRRGRASSARALWSGGAM